MRTSSPDEIERNICCNAPRMGLGLLLAVLLLLAPVLSAQTLAHKNWEGSGISAEAWWRTAVFYRIHVASFQDSDGDGTGDLRGIAQRLDYLQSLGIDVVVLEPPFDEAGFDDLLREASRRHIRLAVAISLREARPAAAVIAEARGWLTRGVAGLDVIPALDAGGSIATFDPEVMRELRKLTDSFPGQRVLLAERVSGTTLAPAPANGRSAQLEDAEVNYIAPDGNGSFAASLRRSLQHTQTDSPTGEPWLVSDDGYRSAPAYDFAGDDRRSLGTKKIIATMLFASPGALDLLFAQELGTDAIDLRATMQWTPSNVTHAAPAPPAPVPPTPPAAPSENVYGTYRPYVAPPKPVAIKSLAPAFDPETLPGFSTVPAKSPASAASRDGSVRRNVAQEDRDPQSLLNFYRKLGQLHHGNATLRNGVMQVLDRDDSEALVWLRRAPSGSRTAGTIVVACNLGPKPLTLSVRDEMERLHLRAATLRPLLASWTDNATAQSVDHIEIPAYSVFMGEAPR